MSVDRTAALDNVRAALATGALILPREIRRVPEFYEHLRASTRVYDPDARGGEGAYDWVHGTRPDHYHHALGYMLVAGRLLVAARG